MRNQVVQYADYKGLNLTMNQLAKFRHSSDKLVESINNWIELLDEKCENNSASNQQKASYYLWTRYSTSIRTLKHICKIELFPDLCVIGRFCIELSSSLQAVLSDRQAADNYIEFEKHAKSNYLRILEYTNDFEKTTLLQEHIRKLGVEDPNNYKWNKWCARLGGITNLIKKYKPEEAYVLYSFFSDFAHGSIISIRILQNLKPSLWLLETFIEFVYSDYLISTRSFLDMAWGPIVTQESERCKKEFDQIAQMFC